jgi:hypothetical protein
LMSFAHMGILVLMGIAQMATSAHLGLNVPTETTPKKAQTENSVLMGLQSRECP